MKNFIESIVAVAIISIVFIGFMYLLKIGINSINEFDLDEKIESFQNDKKLFCTTGVASNQKLLVDKNNNWEIYKDAYFKKGDLLLEIRLCKEEE